MDGELRKPEKALAPRPSALAWKIPGTEEPGGLQSMGSQKSCTQLRGNNNHDLTHDICFRLYLLYLCHTLGLDSVFEFRLDYLGQIILTSLYHRQASTSSFTTGAFWLRKLHDPVLVLSLHGDILATETSPTTHSPER